MDFLFANGAAWFAVPAIIGSVLFLIQMTGIMGHHDGDGSGGMSGDAGGHHGGAYGDTGDVSGGGAGHHSPTHATAEDGGHVNPLAGVISIQSAAAFAMGFGLGGFASFRGSGLNLGISMAIGFGCGVAFVALLAMLFRQARRLSSSGNIGIGALVGAEADVTVRIPASGAGKGEIRAVLGDRERRCAATTTGESIAPRTHVLVERVNGDNSVTVRVASSAKPSGASQV